MMKRIKLAVSMPIYLGHDAPGLARRQALFDEARRRRLSISKLVWDLIIRSAQGQLQKDIKGLER